MISSRILQIINVKFVRLFVLLFIINCVAQPPNLHGGIMVANAEEQPQLGVEDTFVVGFNTTLTGAPSDTKNFANENGGIVQNDWPATDSSGWYTYAGTVKTKASAGIEGGGNIYCLPTNDQIIKSVGKDWAIRGWRFVLPDYNTIAKDVSKYAETGMVTLGIKIDPGVQTKRLYFAIGELYKNQSGYTNYIGVPVEDYYDIEKGGYQKVAIPLSAFKLGGNNFHAYVWPTWGSKPTVAENIDLRYIRSIGIIWTLNGYASDLTDGSGDIFVDYANVVNVKPAKNFSVNEIEFSGIELKWQPSDSIISEYRIYREDMVNTPIGVVNANQLEFTDLNGGEPFEANRTYSYYIRAYDKYGGYSEKAEASAYVGVVGIPKNFAAQSVPQDDEAVKVRLSWDTPSYGKPNKFIIYRDDSIIAAVDAQENQEHYEYIDVDGLINGTIYKYYIKSMKLTEVNGTIEENYSDATLAIEVMAVPVLMPQNLSLKLNPDNTISLSWYAISNAVSYAIMLNGSVISRVNETNYLYTDVEYNKQYYFEVKAINSGGVLSLPAVIKAFVFDDPNTERKIAVYDDEMGTNFTMSVSENVQAISVNNPCIRGDKSMRIDFTSGVKATQAFTITNKNIIDLKQLRQNNESLRFWIYADDKVDIKGISVSLGYNVTLSSKTYPLRTSVPIKNYVSQRNIWEMVEIPLKDFPDSGTYYPNDQPFTLDFDFAKATEIAILGNMSETLTSTTIYIDDMYITGHLVSPVDRVALKNGTVLTNGSSINTNTDVFKIHFKDDLNWLTLNCNTVYITHTDTGNVLNTYGKFNDETNEYSLILIDPLEKEKGYSITVNGVVTKYNVPVPGPFKFTFSTDDTAPIGPPASFLEQQLKMSVHAGIVGQPAMVVISMPDQNKPTYFVNGIDLEITYDKGVLVLSNEEDITLSDQLKNAVVTADNSKGTIKINATGNQLQTFSGEMLKIKFNTIASVNSQVRLGGKFAVYNSKAGKGNDMPVTAVVQVEVKKKSNDKGPSASSGGRPSGSVNNKNTEPLISDTPVPEKVQKGRLKDSAEIPWAEESINYLFEKGIVNGYPDNTFRPAQNLKKEEYIAMIVSAFRIIDETAESSFKDVSKDEWYYKYIASAEKNGIVLGKDDGAFGIGEEINRQEMSVILHRVINFTKIRLKTVYDKVIFDDESHIDDYAMESIKNLQQSGIVKGTGDNKFSPKDKVNRAMAANIIYNTLKLDGR